MDDITLLTRQVDGLIVQTPIGAYSPDLNSAATLRFGLMLADRPGLADTDLALASQDAALACSAVGAS